MKPQQFVRQEQIDLGHEIYYAIYREDGSSVELSDPLPGLEPILIDKKGRPSLPIQSIIPSLPSSLPKAEDCLSANEGKWCTAKPLDPFANEKYKGEQFFTHKSSPGLVIKKDGQVIHETKMSDMYKRRD